MSLAVLNEDASDLSERYREVLARALRYTRLVAAVTELHGQSAVKPLHDAIGTRIHPGGRVDADAIIGESLVEVGLPASLAASADSDEYDPQMRASHFDGIIRRN